MARRKLLNMRHAKASRARKQMLLAVLMNFFENTKKALLDHTCCGESDGLHAVRDIEQLTEKTAQYLQVINFRIKNDSNSMILTGASPTAWQRKEFMHALVIP